MEDLSNINDLNNINELLGDFELFSFDADKIVNIIITYFFIILIFFLIILLIISISNYKLLKKAGRKGWKAFIPFLGTYELFEISGIDGYLIFIQFIPAVGHLIYKTIKMINKVKLSEKFNQNNVLFQTGLVLLPVIFLPILAFSDKKYIVNDKPNENAI